MSDFAGVRDYDLVQFVFPKFDPNVMQRVILGLRVNWDAAPNSSALTLIWRFDRGKTTSSRKGSEVTWVSGERTVFDYDEWLERRMTPNSPLALLRIFILGQAGVLADHVDDFIRELKAQDSGVPNRAELNWILRHIIEHVRAAQEAVLGWDGQDEDSRPVSFGVLMMSAREYRAIYNLNDRLSAAEREEAIALVPSLESAIEAFSILETILGSRSLGRQHVLAEINEITELQRSVRLTLRALDKISTSKVENSLETVEVDLPTARNVAAHFRRKFTAEDGVTSVEVHLEELREFQDSVRHRMAARLGEFSARLGRCARRLEPVPFTVRELQALQADINLVVSSEKSEAKE